MRGVGETRTPLLIVLGTVVLNFLLDPLFIFGFGPLPPQGVMGAALATLATQGLAAALGIAIFCAAVTASSCRGAISVPTRPTSSAPSPWACPARSNFRRAASGRCCCRFWSRGFGTVTLRGYGVGSNILQFVTIPAMGMSQAVRPW